MKRPRVRFPLRALLLLPVAIALAVVAADRLTAPPVVWTLGAYEVDAVDAADLHPIKARVSVTYEGVLAGHPDSDMSWVTDGDPYGEYRFATPERSYAAVAGIVGHRLGPRLLRRRDRSFVDGARFRVEAEGYEPFAFTPVDRWGRPLEYETWDPPVFRVALRPVGSKAAAYWKTRPELKLWDSRPEPGGPARRGRGAGHGRG